MYAIQSPDKDELNVFVPSGDNMDVIHIHPGGNIGRSITNADRGLTYWEELKALGWVELTSKEPIT
jgi:hypothetical protein